MKLFVAHEGTFDGRRVVGIYSTRELALDAIRAAHDGDMPQISHDGGRTWLDDPDIEVFELDEAPRGDK